MSLKFVIDNSDSFELSAPTICVQSEFIFAALRAAKYSNPLTRADILKDVGLLLNCDKEDLAFLFDSKVTKNRTAAYKLDMPDYRPKRSEINLQPAE